MNENELINLRNSCMTTALQSLGSNQTYAAVQLAKQIYDWSMEGKVPNQDEIAQYKTLFVRGERPTPSAS